MTPTSRRLRARWVIGFALLAAAGGGILIVLPRARPERRSVLFVCVDTLRADALGVYSGRPREPSPTPTIDRLAEQGTVFEKALSQAPATGPSIASLLTGRYPIEHRVLHSTAPLPPDEHTMAQTFRAAGYRTAAFVSSSILSARYGFGRGFELYDDHFETPYAGGQFTRDGARTVDAASLWLATVGRDPFFLWVHLFDPHAPYRSHDAAGPPDAITLQRLYALERGTPAERAATLATVRSHYEAEVAYVDHQIGRLLAVLERQRRLDDTLVLITADHGEELFDHGSFYGHYRSLSQSVLHVPLILWGPGRVPSGRRVRERVENVDVFPTLLALLGLPRPDGVSGRDRTPLLRGAEPGRDSDDTVRAQREPYEALEGGPGYAALRGRWKLVWLTRGGASLYDLGADPHERRDLAADHSEQVGELKSALDPWIARTKPIVGAGGTERDREALRALGYLRPAESPSPRPTPPPGGHPPQSR